MTIRSIAVALAAAATFAIPAAASAGTPEPQKVTVQYKDLDLATVEGQNELDQRLDKAARQVCGLNDVQTGTRINSRESRQCFDQARAQFGARLSSLISKQNKG